MSAIRPVEHFGGMFDTRLGRYYDESPNPVVWMCSAEQRRLIVGDDNVPLQTLVEGGEGAGKTTGALARWLLLRMVRDFLGRGLEFGCTAPTQSRLERVKQALMEAMPPDWYSYRQRDWLFTFASGAHRLRLVSAHRQSEAEGSPVQGYDWAGGGADEAQDQLDTIEDIRARGRRAIGGLFPLLLTATFKSSPSYRSFRDKWSATANRGIEKLSCYTNPYVEPEFWAARRRELTAREFIRRIEAGDVGPERQTYYAWDRAQNLRPVPRIGAEPITEILLARWGQRYSILGGHDPGNLFRATLLLRAYRVRGIIDPCWWVIDEITSQDATTETHVKHLTERLRQRWQCQLLDRKGRPAEDGKRVLLRADPWTDIGNDQQQPDKSVYKVFKAAGYRILPARIKPSTETIKPMQVPLDAGIEMVNTLFCNAEGVRRLYVDCDDQRQPAAPRLVESLETSQRDLEGKAERNKKDYRDPSHWPACLRYSLWELEKPREFREPWEREAA